MDSIIRATSKPKVSVMLPSAVHARSGISGAPAVSADSFREILRETHEELAVASAIDGIGSIRTTSESSARQPTEPTLQSVMEEARQKGFEQGHAEGLVKGQASATNEWREKLEDLDLLIEAFQSEREDMMPKLEDDLVAIVFEAVTAILGEAASSQRVIQEAVRKAAAGVARDSPITIRISPSQFAQLSGADDLNFIAKRKGAVEWADDVRVELGGCIVETGRGTLDARLETQVDRLRKALLMARTQS